jgi:hypothetical protein
MENHAEIASFSVVRVCCEISPVHFFRRHRVSKPVRSHSVSVTLFQSGVELTSSGILIPSSHAQRLLPPGPLWMVHHSPPKPGG